MCTYIAIMWEYIALAASKNLLAIELATGKIGRVRVPLTGLLKFVWLLLKLLELNP